MDSVGAILKSAREEKKIPLNQVSSDTHILLGYIQAIEENRFQDLPGETYCAGFIGTLARYYGLDSGRLVAMFRGSFFSSREALRIAPTESMDHSASKRKFSNTLALAGVSYSNLVSGIPSLVFISVKSNCISV